jgi:hypothetical protein
MDDTSPDARRVLIDALRRMTLRQRWERLRSIQHTARVLHSSGYRYRHPEASDDEVRRDWVRARLGAALAREVLDREPADESR